MGTRTNVPSSNTKVKSSGGGHPSGLERGKIDFVGQAVLFGIISTVLVVASLVVIFVKGLNYGIDFAGGTEIQVKFAKTVNVDDVRGFVDGLKLEHSQLQSFGDSNEFLIRFQTLVGKDPTDTNEKMKTLIGRVTDSLKQKFADAGPEIRRVDSVGPQVGAELKRNALLALFYSLFIILIYVGLRFDYKYAPGAVFCLFHDAVIVVGIFALLGREINTQIMAAVLTLIGYSLNDTIVNYDRIRENVTLYPDAPLDVLINRSINEVLGRTLLTVVTVAIAVICLYIWGGGVIEEIALALGIGLFFGTYSSIYVAAPIILIGEKLRAKT